jgi:hypothetical protein
MRLSAVFLGVAMLTIVTRKRPINARLDHDGRFDGSVSSYDSRDGYQVFFYGSGRVDERLARGRLFLFYDPGSLGDHVGWTSGPVRWKAAAGH